MPINHIDVSEQVFQENLRLWIRLSAAASPDIRVSWRALCGGAELFRVAPLTRWWVYNVVRGSEDGL